MKKMSKVLSFFLVASLIFSAMVNTPAVSAGVGGSFGKNIDKSAIPEMIVSGTAAPDLILDRPVVAHEDDLISSIEVYDDADNGDIQLFSTDDITPSEFNTIFAPGITNSISEQKLSLKSFANEEISSYNGELTLRFSDISLPGRNGLNLNIGRVYQTAQADFAAKKIMQAKNPNGVLESINAYDDSSYLNDRYNLGAGWSFNFPSVQISKDYIPYPSGDTYLYTIEEKIYYHTGSGDVYQADFSESALPSHLKRYYTDNAVFLQNDTSYSNEQATSYYSFKDPDNIVQYFADDGRLIGIRDKYGNTINFEHNMAKIVNRVPNGGFENGLDMWNTSSSGVTSIYTGRYDDSALRMNSSGFAFAASAAIEVEPDTWYSLSADVFPRYGVDGDVVIEVHLMDAAYNERFVNIITVPYDLAENTWSEVSGSFATASSTRYVYIAIVAEEGIGHLYFDNICVEKPKPLISKITDSIGREIIFDYQGRIENKNAPNDLILTIKKPNGDVAKTIIYDRKAVSFTIEMDDGTRRALHAWYLSSSNTEGVDGYPVRYYYGGVTPDAKEYEELAWKPGLIYNVSATIKPMMSIVQYKNHVSIYEYEKVRKGLGRFGYYDTLRVKARYSKYDSADGYTGELNRLDYSYGGYCGNNNVDNETGYPVANFIDPDDYSGDDIIFTSVSTAAFAENDELATIHTYKNSRLYSKEISSSKLYQSNKNYYHYNSTFKDSIAFIENVIRNYNDEVHTYAAMTYNDWGGLETETCLLEEDLFDNPSERAKYTITYTYHEIHKKVTSAQYYNDADGEPVTELWDYDSLGRLIKYTNAMGEETEYFYENSIYPGNITKTTMADPSNTHYVLGSQTAQTIYTYDQYNAFVASEARSYQGGTSITLYEYEYLFGNIEKQINPDNDWWAFEYDEKGRLLSEYSPIVQGDGYIFYFVTDYAYPGLFFDPSYTIDPTRVFDVVVKNEYVYNITSGTYSSKSASQYLYGSEGEGLLLRQFDFDRPAGDGYEPIITQYRYDNYTRLTEVIDDAGKSTKAKYDAFGRVEEITDNAGSKYVTEYNPTARNQLSYFVPVSAPATKENHIKLQFDAFGNLTTKYAYPNGYNETPISAEYRYNIAGKITGYTDSNVNEYSYEYDKTGRLAKTVFPDGTSTAASYNKFGSPNFEHQYDEDGNVAASRATVIDEAGNKRFTFYQYNNLLINSDAYQSDAMGRIIDKNEGGATYTMQYDGMSNITKLTSGDTSINYRYGRHGITKIVPADSSVTAIQYAYNNFGRLYGKAQDDVSMMYQYTTTGQVEVSWDSLGMITEYYYDNLNRVNSVYALNSDYVFDYYDDGMVKTVYSGPLTTTYTYDNLNRTTSIITKRGTTTINNLAYTYDNNSNILTETRNGVTSTYTYDGLNRLKTVNYGDGNTITYYYDARGNHERESHSNGSEKVFGYDKSNRLISVAENGIITDEYEYNAAGAVISHNNDTYTYDNWDRLASATINGTAYTYKYDGNGLRTAKNDKKYIVDINGNVVAERNGSTTTAQNVYINGQIMSRKIGGNWYFYLKNAHGDVIGMADSNGNIVNTYTYDAWGNIRSTGTVETVENPIKYAGEYYDEESGLYYLRARYYDPLTSRFISEDPARDGLNWYTYCGNNPLRYIDPSGLYYLEKDANGQVYAVIESGDTLSGISYAEVGDSNAYTKLGYADPGYLEVGQRVNITEIYNDSYPVPTNIAFSKTSHTQGDSGLRDVPDKEISRRARDKSLSGEERRRYQKEEKLRGQRNKQKRQSNFQNETYGPQPFVGPPLPANNQYSNAPTASIPENTFWRDVGTGAIVVVGVAAGVAYFFYTGSPDMIYKFAH